MTRLSTLLQSFDLDSVLAGDRLERIQPPVDCLPKLGEGLLDLGFCRACVLGYGRNAGYHVLVQDVHVPAQVIDTAFQAAEIGAQFVLAALQTVQPLLDSIKALFEHPLPHRTTTIHRLARG